MMLWYWLAALAVVGLLVYLLVALLKPEIIS